MKTILCNGVFDILHEGHVLHLQEARAKGDFLIVALTVDECVNKGPHRPLNTWTTRALVLRALRCVDLVVASRSSCEAILNIRPDIFVKGCDYNGKLSKEDLEACAVTGAEWSFTFSPKMSVTDIINDRFRNG